MTGEKLVTADKQDAEREREREPTLAPEKMGEREAGIINDNV